MYSGYTIPMKKHDKLPDFSKLCPPEQNHIAKFISQQLFFFFLCSIGGFLWEVAIFFIKDGRFTNRGFLYGPWLPVYGVGAVLFYVLLADKPLLSTISGCHRIVSYTPHPLLRRSYAHGIKKHPLIVFLLSLLIGTGLELLIGWLLDTVWMLRYWDYRSYPFNFDGYICLYSAIGFGIAGTLWVCFLANFFTELWLHLPSSIRRGINTFLTFLFVIDCAAALILPNIGHGITFP